MRSIWTKYIYFQCTGAHRRPLTGSLSCSGRAVTEKPRRDKGKQKAMQQYVQYVFGKELMRNLLCKVH